MRLVQNLCNIRFIFLTFFLFIFNYYNLHSYETSPTFSIDELIGFKPITEKIQQNALVYLSGKKLESFKKLNSINYLDDSDCAFFAIGEANTLFKILTENPLNIPILGYNYDQFFIKGEAAINLFNILDGSKQNKEFEIFFLTNTDINNALTRLINSSYSNFRIDFYTYSKIAHDNLIQYSSKHYSEKIATRGSLIIVRENLYSTINNILKNHMIFIDENQPVILVTGKTGAQVYNLIKKRNEDINYVKAESIIIITGEAAHEMIYEFNLTRRNTYYLNYDYSHFINTEDVEIYDDNFSSQIISNLDEKILKRNESLFFITDKTASFIESVNNLILSRFGNFNTIFEGKSNLTIAFKQQELSDIFNKKPNGNLKFSSLIINKGINVVTFLKSILKAIPFQFWKDEHQKALSEWEI
jgi:hypothetical protein